MSIRTISKLLLLLMVSASADASLVSRVKTFTDGSILTASDLNAEFNNLIDGLNNVDNANISAAAAITPSKISATIAGDGLGRDGTTGALSCNVDDSTIEISGDTLQIKDLGISTGKIAANAVTGAKLNSNVVDNSTLQYTSSQLSIKDSGVATAKIADGAVTQAKRAALGQQISSSSGTFTTTGTSYVDATNLSVTITTTGRPVFVGIIGDPETANRTYFFAGSNVQPSIKILRNGSQIYSTTYYSESSTAQISTVGIFTIDAPSAGTYTYKVQMSSSGGGQVGVVDAKLIAFEL